MDKTLRTAPKVVHDPLEYARKLSEFRIFRVNCPSARIDREKTNRQSFE